MIPLHRPSMLLPIFAVVGFGTVLAGSAVEPEAIQHGLVYGTVVGKSLILDLALPAGEGLHPAVVCIHGGAMVSGSRNDLATVIGELAKAGFVAVSIDYRLAPEAVFPAQVEDAKCAVRWLRATATEHRIDARRIGAMGFSAGGHLTLMLAFCQPACGFEGTGGHAEQSSSIQAAVDFYGSADLRNDGTATREQQRIVASFLGTNDPASPLLATDSPITYVHRGTPPLLVMHGLADKLVPVAQSARLIDKVHEAGSPGELVTFPDQGHGFKGADASKSVTQAIRFLTDHLMTQSGSPASH